MMLLGAILALVLAAQAPGEALASDLLRFLPAGWTCTVISEKGKMGHPHGLEEPLFRLDFVNSTLTFRASEGPGAPITAHPNLRLHFHPRADRERILRTIKAEEAYSWAIPTLFAETKEYVIVTSPMWQNHFTEKVGDATWGAGVYTDEANKQIDPLLRALKAHFR